MIDSYFVNTPNGRKVSIMLAETGLPHRLIRGDRGEVDHLSKEFRKINPNARLPAIVDHAPIGGGAPFPVFESGAILIYLADKTGKFLSQEPRQRHTALQWLIWQMAGLGPMHGQAHHFARYAPEPVDVYAQQRFTREAERLLYVMNRRLGEAAYLGGDDYSIADMCSWPWINQMDVIGLDRAKFPNVNRVFETVAARPGVIEGCRFELPKLMKEPGRIPLTADQFSRGFGDIMHAANRAD